MDATSEKLSVASVILNLTFIQPQGSISACPSSEALLPRRNLACKATRRLSTSPLTTRTSR